ncbi:MAG TPA: peroxiredoxin [Planctomycetes bacterium]|nr:peroxiredoxin [Planctomycetota bacterium]
MAIELGKRAPAFTLPDSSGEKHRLTEHAGRWVVVYFYPRDDTPACTTEAKDFTRLLPQFRRAETAVFGCSPDDLDSHRKFEAKHRIKVPLLSDPSRRVMAKYEAWGPKTMYGKVTEGVIRSTVIIDPKGRIAHRWKRVQARRHAERVLAKLKSLQACYD